MVRRKLTFANVTSFLALFVALSAGSYAAITLPANSVGKKQIKAKAVTSPKLASDAVTGPKVKDGSLTGRDINLTSLGKVPSAAAADTAATIARVKTVSATGTSRAATQTSVPFDGATATCDQGLLVVGGGVMQGDPSSQLTVDSFPNGSTAWSARVANFSPGTPTFTVYALCAPAASTQ
jgi:hypothetical protein